MKRTRRRYLAVETESPETFSSHEILDAVWAAVSKLFGEYGASQAGLALIDYDETNKLLVIRVGHEALDMVRASLASTTRIGNKPVALHVLAVSGTLKGLDRKLEEKRVA